MCPRATVPGSRPQIMHVTSCATSEMLLNLSVQLSSGDGTVSHNCED